MKNYVYILSINDTKFHAGYCRDIEKAVKFYKNLPSAFANVYKLVYLEELPDDQKAFARYKEILAYTDLEKGILIDNINPDRVELEPGINIEL